MDMIHLKEGSDLYGTGDIKMVFLFTKLNIDLYNQGWAQEEIDLVLFGNTEDLRKTEFKGR